MDKGHDACVIVVQLATTDEIDIEYKDTNYTNLFGNSLRIKRKSLIIVSKMKGSR